MNSQFPVINHLIHVNHAAVGPWPTVTVEAIKAFSEENLQFGSKNYSSWLQLDKVLRKNLAKLINAPSSDEIALVKNTSEGLSFVAQGLPWSRGDNVVGIQQEFPSNRFVWDALSSKGVEFRQLNLQAASDPEQALFDLCDHSTRLISVSAIQYYDGFRMDLARIGQFCREQNILFCVDAIQQIGALPFDVQHIQADFVIADGHKWLLSPEGLGLFYIRKAAMERLQVSQYGWHMADIRGDYTAGTFDLLDTAQRFECGSPNMLGIHALNASVEMLLVNDIEKIGVSNLLNSQFLIEQLVSIRGVQVLSDHSDLRLSAIVTFRSQRVADAELYQYLSDNQVLCVPRGGGIRLSPHFYTPRDQLERIVSIVKALH